jgi:erythromycin esterase-like protein
MDERARAALRDASRPLLGEADLDALLERIGDARIVMLGEATHGTREFYEWRTRITMRLVREKGFGFVGVEGDWPDCFRLNQYVKDDEEADPTAFDALHKFQRWPTWMWANHEVADLLEQMRDHNDTLNAPPKVGFYGLDVYSLFDSMQRLVARLRDLRPEVVEAARAAWACFEPYGEDAQRYAVATDVVPADCRDELAALLARTRRELHTLPDGRAEARLDAEQNAVTAVNAEAYYRAMMKGGPTSWNVRDTHMMDTLDRLLEHHGDGSKAIVWAHNTHVGDARATDMAAGGMVNIGQLARERHGEEAVVLVGFGTHHGRVVAARGWEEPMRVMTVPAARAGSLEDALHEAGGDRLLLFRRRERDLGDEIPHRAIGVVYHAERERGNYVPTIVPRRYDAFVHIDATDAVRPLHVPVAEEQTPETFPWGY